MGLRLGLRRRWRRGGGRRRKLRSNVTLTGYPAKFLRFSILILYGHNLLKGTKVKENTDLGSSRRVKKRKLTDKIQVKVLPDPGLTFVGGWEG